MNEPPTRRSVLVVAAFGILALVCLLLGRNWIGNYAEQQRANRRDDVAEPNAGVAGRVLYADGSPAAGARVVIRWHEPNGRPGTTPAITDDKGAFTPRNVPRYVIIDEVHASMGPVAAKTGELEALVATAGPYSWSLTLPREFRMAGLVRRVGDRSPVVGATLDLAGASATTGAAGEFKLEHVPWTAIREGRPVVHIVADGCAPLDWPLSKDGPPEMYGDLTILMETAK